MKIAQLSIAVTTVALVSLFTTASAALIESVESARASGARQKVDAFLGEQQVVDQMTKLGVTPGQAHTRLAKLSDAQMEQLAAQIDLLQAGGTIQGAHANPFGPITCVVKYIGDTISHIISFLFCWDDV